MTTQLKDKLERIKAALRAWIEADKARSQGAWFPYGDDSGNSQFVSLNPRVTIDARAQCNARFIALASTMSRRTAESLLVAIETLNHLDLNSQTCNVFQPMLEEIAARFPDSI